MAEAEIQADVPVTPPAVKRFSLARLLAALIAFLRVHKRVLIFSGAVIGVVLAAGSTTVVISQQPGLCVNCHEIRPAYDQWHTSSHYGVTCVNCHTEPGLPGYLKINLVGAQHLVTHLVSDYRVPTEADVQDASCLSCHPRESRPERERNPHDSQTPRRSRLHGLPHAGESKSPRLRNPYLHELP